MDPSTELQLMSSSASLALSTLCLRNGTVVDGLTLDDFAKDRLKTTGEELLAERS